MHSQLNSSTYSSLLEAVQAGDVVAVASMTEAGADVDVRNELLETELHIAAGEGHAAICELLIRAKADLHATDLIGSTPLHVAASAGKADVCALLLAHGAEVNGTAPKSRTPLHMAVQDDCVEAAAVLVEAGANPHARDAGMSTVMDYAVTLGHVGSLRLLGRTFPELIHQSEKEYFSPMELAVRSGQLSIVEVLVREFGINLDDPLSDGRTPLELAVRNEYMTALLLSLKSELATNQAIAEDGAAGTGARASRSMPSL